MFEISSTTSACSFELYCKVALTAQPVTRFVHHYLEDISHSPSRMLSRFIERVTRSLKRRTNAIVYSYRNLRTLYQFSLICKCGVVRSELDVLAVVVV